MLAMPRDDPWRVHLGLIPLVALLAPTPPDLAHWLRCAHQAVGSPPMSCYLAARNELLSHRPPWSRPGDNLVTADVHDSSTGYALRRDEMAKLLGEIANDGEVRVSQNKLVLFQ